ncbi:MAG: endonuclease [Actinobacteria bacterium]|nr:endonuclease [Actinomycetota bacterium]
MTLGHPGDPAEPSAVRRPVARLLTLLLLALGPTVAALAPVVPITAAQAATTSVAAARAGQDGSTATVRGYVVGQPTSSSTVVTSGFPNDYALALADSPGVTDTSQMLYVQVPSSFRDAWGLQSNPSLLGQQIDVTGAKEAYFSRPGLKSASDFALADGPGDPDPGPDPGAGGGTTEYDSTYWAPAIGKSGAALESSLHAIISSGVTRLSYSQVWVALRDTDEDPADSSHVIELYSGDSISKNANGGGVDQWNREHVWAKSHGDFGTATGPGTDIHHLRPTDVTVNGARGNLDFDEGGTQSSEAPGNYADSDSWEPRDAVKGDVARMVFYMSVRYEGGDGFADLEVSEQVGRRDLDALGHLGRLSTLLRWHEQDPPDAFERARNDAIFETWQGNRNPFVDRPEWVAAIW